MRFALFAASVMLLTALTAQAQSEEEDIRRSAETMAKIESLQKRGYFLAKTGKYTEAMEALEQIPPLLDLPDETLLFNMGTIAMDGLKDCNKAVLYYQGYLYAAPNDKGTPEVRRRLARCLKNVRPGTLVVESRPDAIEVRVNNIVVGRTPIRGLELAPGDYRLTSERVDYNDFASSITINPSVETRQAVRMIKVIYKGTLTVKTKPKGARVWLNDNEVGNAPVTLKNLDTKKYLVRIEMNGMDRWIRYVEVLRDAEVTVEATLENTGVQVPIPPLPRND